MDDIKLTIFTPTYNRREKLNELYHSLCIQTCKKFIWMIVDDGSIDDTGKMVSEWKKECDFEISYIYQSNRGKYIAHNRGVEACTTDWFVCIDSDEHLFAESVAIIYREWENYEKDSKVAGIAAPRKMKDGVGFAELSLPEYGTLQELYVKHHYFGETALIYRTAVLKAFLFPEVENEKFMKESVVYWEIDRKYMMRYCPEFLCEGSYLSDGLTNNIISQQVKSPNCTLLHYKVSSAYKLKLIERIKAYGCYLAWRDYFKLTDGFRTYKISLPVRVCGWLLCPRYKKIFKVKLEGKR